MKVKLGKWGREFERIRRFSAFSDAVTTGNVVGLGQEGVLASHTYKLFK